MKAIVVYQYGGPEVLKFEDYPDPVPGQGEVLLQGSVQQRQSDRLRAARRVDERFLSAQIPGADRSGCLGHCGQDRARSQGGSGKVLLLP
jgi:hypothetical protein